MEPRAVYTVDALAQQAVEYDKAEFIETSTGNKVSRKSVLCGSQNIHLNGKVVHNEIDYQQKGCDDEFLLCSDNSERGSNHSGRSSSG